ncbi:MAG: hypothetical protein NUW23_13560 [Firmicutes bacterium]|nr:hypothetical protein [Bacillota bacterium]
MTGETGAVLALLARSMASVKPSGWLHLAQLSKRGLGYYVTVEGVAV